MHEPGKNRTVRDVGEFALIRRLQKRLGRRPQPVPLGDDAAVLNWRENTPLVVTCDIQMEGIHFRRSYLTPEGIGYRAMAVNLSDLAAMGAVPEYAVVSLGLPGHFSVDELDALYDGFENALSRFGGEIVGGNLSFSPGRLLVDITLIGRPAARRVLTRSGARPGDRIYLTGTCGAAALGFLVLNRLPPEKRKRFAPLVQAHLAPVPLIALGSRLAEIEGITAAIDTSDGLVQDLGHICEASRVGAVLFAEALPVPPLAQELCRELGRDLQSIILGGGEDYQLLFTTRPAVSEEAVRRLARETGSSVQCIGEIVAGEGVWLQEGKSRRRLKASGWDHFRQEAAPE